MRQERNWRNSALRLSLLTTCKATFGSRIRTLVRSFSRGRPAFIEHNFSSDLARAVDDLTSTRSFDWCHLNQVDTFPYFYGRPELPLVLDTHNLHWEYYERRSAHTLNPVMSVFVWARRSFVEAL